MEENEKGLPPRNSRRGYLRIQTLMLHTIRTRDIKVLKVVATNVWKSLLRWKDQKDPNPQDNMVMDMDILIHIKNIEETR